MIEQVINLGNKKADVFCKVFEKDFGNISLTTNFKQLSEVVIKTGNPGLVMGIDRKVFNVEKNMLFTGGSAIDVLKNIPHISIGFVQRNFPDARVSVLRGRK